MRRTRPTRHPLVVVLAAAALAVSLGGTLAGCRTGADPGASEASTATSASTPTPSEPSADPGATSSAAPTPPAGTPSAGSSVLTAPVDGATVQGPDVLITGEGTAFEATMRWRVVTAGTEDVVQEGSTMAGSNGEIGPFSVSVTLDPGVYTAEVWEPSMKDETDTVRRNLVSATFTVR